MSVGWRQARITESYNGHFVNRDFSHTWMPYERMSIMDVSARYIINPRMSVLATLPIVSNNFSMLYPPNGPGGGVRHGTNANGIGDLSIFHQIALLNPKNHPFENVSVGVGMKIPTGDWNVQGDLPNLTGTGFMRRAIYPPASYLVSTASRTSARICCCEATLFSGRQVICPIRAIQMALIRLFRAWECPWHLNFSTV
jgi:hypothetical protein